MVPPAVANVIHNNTRPHSTQLPAIPKGSRCEITPQVRSIAQRTQTRMFKRTSLFFNQATFQVPNTVEEAFENMRIGTTDLDRNKSESTNGITDLYLLSWSNTQFFSAQMAALGFRFISCNLRRKTGLENPPPVEQWLRLERFSAPLARPSTSTKPPNGTTTPTLSPPASNPPARVSKPFTVLNPKRPSLSKLSIANITTPITKAVPLSTVPSAALKQKRSAPSDPPSDRENSPAHKLQRGTNGIRLPSQPAPKASQPASEAAPLPKANISALTPSTNPNKTTSTQQPRNKSRHAQVPVIDLT